MELAKKFETGGTTGNYQDDPEGYANDILGVTWWPGQAEIARNLLKYKRVAVEASHSIGKTHIAGGLVNWWFDSFNPSICLTTAPTERQVIELLWKEVRSQRGGRPGLLPKAARLESSPTHFASGYTANDANAFQGRHERKVLIIFDEAVGIDGQFFDAAEGMLTGADCYWLCIFNPTDTASRMYEEVLSGTFHRQRVSALDHPNIAAGLRGEPPTYPGAVQLVWVEERLKRWCERIEESDTDARDIEFPPGSGIWYRPGPLFESRVLGRWPTTGVTSVWSEAGWEATQRQQPIDYSRPLEIGCDVARFGDDMTTFHVRRGRCSLHHESRNGWSTSQTAGKIKSLAREFSVEDEDPAKVLCKIDDGGVGGGVIDQADGFEFVGINSGSVAIDEDGYPNRRSELWFTTSESAMGGALDLSRLDEDSLKNIRRQVMAPTWKMDSRGRRVVEPKADTKKRIGRSPDDADGFNLAYATQNFLSWDFETIS